MPILGLRETQRLILKLKDTKKAHMPNAHYKTAFTGTHKHRNRSTLTVHAKLNTFDYKTQVSFKTGNHQKNSTFFASVTKRSKMEIGCF